MKVDLVAPGVHRVDLGLVNAYICADDAGLTLIDCGLATSAVDMRQAIEVAGYPSDAPRRVILTHHHDDHRGTASEFAGAGATIVAHAADAPVIRGVEPGMPPVFVTDSERELHAQIAPNVPPSPASDVHTILNDGDAIDLLGGAAVAPVPGHTAGSIALHLPVRGLLFTGDAAFSIEGKPFVGGFNVDTTLARESFRRMAALDFDIALVGHGDPVTEGSARFRKAAARIEAEA